MAIIRNSVRIKVNKDLDLTISLLVTTLRFILYKYYRITKKQRSCTIISLSRNFKGCYMRKNIMSVLAPY